jgi:DNA-binding NarL/FixJ family response regulator
MKISVTLTDDHPVVINGIQKMLAEYDHITVCDTCRDGETLLSSLAIRQPDVLLLDIQMKGMQGDELARMVTALYPQIAILALTNLDQTFHVRNMFLNGAKGYILKTTEPNDLIHAIETVYKGNQYIDSCLREHMLQDMLETRAVKNNIPALTKRETEILGMIANEMTSPEIAKKLFVSLSAVENHRLNLLFKLNVKNSVGLVKKAIHLGLVKT